MHLSSTLDIELRCSSHWTLRVLRQAFELPKIIDVEIGAWVIECFRDVEYSSQANDSRVQAKIRGGLMQVY